MKKIIYSLFLVFSLAVFSGCKDITTEDTSKLTYFVTYEILGGETMLVEVGTPFVDPGVIAMEGDKDVSSSVKVSGSVNSNALGVYFISYSAVNVDGFPSSVTRTVAVYDPDITTNIAGNYTVATGTHRYTFSNGAIVAYNGYPVSIKSIAPGIFYVSDFFGGYYDKRAGYGSSYAMYGYISLNEDNTIDVLSSHVNGWGDGLDDLEDAVYDPDTDTIQWGAIYVDSYSFNVILSK